MNCRILVLVRCLGLFTLAPLNACAVQLHVESPRAEFASQAILTMSITVLFENAEVERKDCFILNDENLKVRLRDSDGRDVGVFPPPGWKCPFDLNGYWRVDSAEGREQTRQFLVNKWRTTNLPVGEYKLEVEIARAGLRLKDDSNVQSIIVSEPNSWEFRLKVVSDDAGIAGKEYAQALERLRATPVTVENIRQIMFDTQCITYSHEPAAFPCQMEFLTGGLRIETPNMKDYQLDILSDNLIQVDRPEVARALVDWIESKPKSDDMQRLNRFKDRILWIIHEMHKLGNPEIVRITAKTVSEYPQPRDPRPRPGMD